MQSCILISLCLFIYENIFAQNVGINTTTPRGPLSFGGPLGQKIILWDDGNPAGNNYGIGVQSGILQLHSFTFNDDIVFGYGSSQNFIERMRVKGNGNVGIGVNPSFILDVADRIRLRSGAGGSAGIWFNNPTNTTTQTFFGVEDATWAGIYGSSGWSFGMNTTNGNIKVMSRLGIGTNTPNSPLSFPAALGRKISFYPGGTGDAGIAVMGNLLQIFSDNPNADIAFGYDQAGNMIERFRIRANGALRVNGNAGAPGQVLQSNGDGGAGSWVSSTNALFNNTVELWNNVFRDFPTPDYYYLPGMDYTFTTTGNAKVMITYFIPVSANYCLGCGYTDCRVQLEYNGSIIMEHQEEVCNSCNTTMTATKLLQVGAGTHNLKIKAQMVGNGGYMGGAISPRMMTVQIIPQ